MYRCPETKLTAGLTISAVLPGLVAFESSSTQIGQRSPVVASITTTGASGSEYRPRWLSCTGSVAASAAGVSRPGTFSTIDCPGLKPSFRS